MKYAKPKVSLLAPAVAAIESGDPTKGQPYIVIDSYHEESNGAYESDE
jgi:hypothetical protein